MRNDASLVARTRKYAREGSVSRRMPGSRLAPSLLPSLRSIRRQEHPRCAVDHGCDAFFRWRWRGLEDEGQEQRGLAHFHELGGREVAIVDREIAGRDVRSEI